MFNVKKIMKKNGFTLIELMLVVSIMLILMGFLIPKFSSYQDKVKLTKAKNTAKQIQTAAMASYGDKNGQFVMEDVQSNIDNLTSAEEVLAKSPIDEAQIIEVSYKSDNKSYTVSIDARNNTYVVTPNTGTDSSLGGNQNQGGS